jgi:hypothetical protein
MHFKGVLHWQQFEISYLGLGSNSVPSHRRFVIQLIILRNFLCSSWIITTEICFGFERDSDETITWLNFVNGFEKCTHKLRHAETAELRQNPVTFYIVPYVIPTPIKTSHRSFRQYDHCFQSLRCAQRS